MSINAERHIITNLNAAIHMYTHTHTHAHMWSCVHMYKVLSIAFVYQQIHRVSEAQHCVSVCLHDTLFNVQSYVQATHFAATVS